MQYSRLKVFDSERDPFPQKPAIFFALKMMDCG
jgi:hypothetical protein